MSDFDTIQKLIRLKRHELPPQDFVEDFVATMHQRQRAELLQRSARGLLWERVTTYFADLFNPKWALAGAAAVAVGMGIVMTKPAASNQAVQNAPTVASLNEATVVSAKEDVSGLQNNLISHHYGGGFADEQNVQPVNLIGPVQGGVQTAGFKGDLEIPVAPQR